MLSPTARNPDRLRDDALAGERFAHCSFVAHGIEVTVGLNRRDIKPKESSHCNR
jgi:hypothetical protein